MNISMQMLRRFAKWSVLAILLIYCGMIGYAYWPAEPGKPAEQLAGPDDSFVTVDGLQLRFRSWGSAESDRPALVLLHGFANSLQTFDSVAPLLADDYFVIAVDLPGFGLSAKPSDHDYSNASQGRIVSSLIAALGLRDTIIGGHSMGGALALHVAEQSPEVAGILLLNPGIITTGVPPVTSYLFFPLPRLAAKIFGQRDFRENFLKGSFVNTELITDSKMDAMMLGPTSDDYLTGTTQLMKFYREGDEVGMLADVRVPTLIVWGNLDRGKPAGEAEQLQSMIPGSKLIRISDAAHYVHEEQPREVAAALRANLPYWAARR